MRYVLILMLYFISGIAYLMSCSPPCVVSCVLPDCLYSDVDLLSLPLIGVDC